MAENLPTVPKNPIHKKLFHDPEAVKSAYEIDLEVASQINPADTIFVSGFWRSGTTWLQRVLTDLFEAKTVYEPFSPEVPDSTAIFPDNIALKKRHRRHYMPYFGKGSTLAGHPLYRFFESAIRSEIPGRWVRQIRKDVDESKSTRVLLKCVRAQLCLRAVQNTFKMPVIHIYRDPRAVYASMKLTKWNWIFDSLNLNKQFLKIDDGRRDFFHNWRHEIKAYDSKDKAAKIMAFWALSEKYVEHSYADFPARMLFVRYEDLCRQKQRLILDVCKRLNLEPASNGGFQSLEKDSLSTSRQRVGASIEDRLFGWKKVLSNTEITEIEAVASHFGFEDRLVTEI